MHSIWGMGKVSALHQMMISILFHRPVRVAVHHSTRLHVPLGFSAAHDSISHSPDLYLEDLNFISKLLNF